MPWAKSKSPDGTPKKKEADKEKVDQLPLVTSTENTDPATPSADSESRNSLVTRGSNAKNFCHPPKRHITTVAINGFDDTDSYLHELQPHIYVPSPSKQHPVISYEKNKSVRIIVKEPVPESLAEPLKRNSRSKDSEVENLFWKSIGNENGSDVNSWIENHRKEVSEPKNISLSPEKLKDEGVKVRPLLDVSWKGSSHTSVLDEPLSSDDCQRSTSTLVNSNISKIGKSTEFQRGFVSICCGISVVVGSAACLRLPGLLFTYGVGSFLLAFLVCLVVVGIPLAYLECGLAQFSNNSVIGVWSLVPLSRGIGWSTVVGCLYWGATSAGLAAPWFHYIVAQNDPGLLQIPRMCRLLNGTNFDAVAYYSHCVYNLSSSWGPIPDLALTWSLPAGLITILMIASLSVTGGPALLAIISASGSLLALLGYGSQLYISISALCQDEKFSKKDVRQFFSPFMPDFESLTFPQVWLAAMSQAFLSLGPGVGMLLNHSANNVFRHPLRRHIWFLTMLTLITTMLVSISIVLEAQIFSFQPTLSSASPKYDIDPVTQEALLTSSVRPELQFLGSEFQFLSINLSGFEERIRTLDNCILFTNRLTDFSCSKIAPGVVKGVPFIVSSHAATFAVGHLTPWIATVLKNLIFLGFLGAAIATSCVCMHVGVVAAREARSLPPAVVALILMAVLSLVAAPMSTQAGASFVYLVDNYVLMPGLLWPSIAMLIALSTCHGVAKIRKDLTFMLESNVSYFWLPIWAGSIPLILIGIALWTFIIEWKELGFIEGPNWCVSVVWSLRVGLLISMPVTAIIVINSQLAYGFKDKVLSSLQSSREWGDWGPQDPIEHHHWRRWREDETQSYASLERRLASKSRPLTYTHSTLSSSSSSTLGRLKAKYRGQSKPYDL